MDPTGSTPWILIGGASGPLAQWVVGAVASGAVTGTHPGTPGFVESWLVHAPGTSAATGILNEIISALADAVALLVVIRVLRRFLSASKAA